MIEGAKPSQHTAEEDVSTHRRVRRRQEQQSNLMSQSNKHGPCKQGASTAGGTRQFPRVPKDPRVARSSCRGGISLKHARVRGRILRHPLYELRETHAGMTFPISHTIVVSSW